jgi:hypothetical protein
MRARPAKLITVPMNGQISIGKGWGGRQIRIEEVNENEIHISAGTFIPDSQRTFFTNEANSTLEKFNEFEKTVSPKATNTKALFAKLRKKSHSK